MQDSRNAHEKAQDVLRQLLADASRGNKQQVAWLLGYVAAMQAKPQG